MPHGKKKIDLNLLECLDAILTERSVTRAAQRLGMSQPGMSNALARLRTLTGDPLLVRSGNEFKPTERALGLAAKVRSGLAALEEIFADEGPFDAASSEGTLTLAAVDSVGVMLMPQLLQALAQQAPMIKVHVRLPDTDRLHGWLAQGECDLAFGYFPHASAELHSSDLTGQALSCITGPGYAHRGQAMDLARYMEARHVMFASPFSDRSPMEDAIDHALAALGLQRTRAVGVSSMLLLPYVVADSPHVAALPTSFARRCASFLPLDVQPLPVQAPPVVIRMLWHQRTHRIGLHRWVRALVHSITHDLSRPEAAVAGG